MAGQASAGAVVVFAPGDGAVRDEVEQFGWPEQMLGCRHVPRAGAAAGVVVCLGAPFAAGVDEGRAARLGRRLARAGVAVQRFHPRGTAPSDGDPAAVSFGTLVDDATRALDLLRDRTGVERVGLVGARLGALVAARVATRHGGAPVALWEPVLDPRRLVEQAARARSAGPRPAAAPGRPGEARPLDLFDSALCTELIDGAAVGDLSDELGARSGPLLVVQTSAGERLGPGYESLVDRCRARGTTVEARCHPCDAERDGTVVPAGPADALVEATASWLAAQLLPSER